MNKILSWDPELERQVKIPSHKDLGLLGEVKSEQVLVTEIISKGSLLAAGNSHVREATGKS